MAKDALRHVGVVLVNVPIIRLIRPRPSARSRTITARANKIINGPIRYSVHMGDLLDHDCQGSKSHVHLVLEGKHRSERNGASLARPVPLHRGDDVVRAVFLLVQRSSFVSRMVAVMPFPNLMIQTDSLP